MGIFIRKSQIFNLTLTGLILAQGLGSLALAAGPELSQNPSLGGISSNLPPRAAPQPKANPAAMMQPLPPDPDGRLESEVSLQYEKANENMSLQAAYLLNRLDDLKGPKTDQQKAAGLGMFCASGEADKDCVDRYTRGAWLQLMAIKKSIIENETSGALLINRTAPLTSQSYGNDGAPIAEIAGLPGTTPVKSIHIPDVPEIECIQNEYALQKAVTVGTPPQMVPLPPGLSCNQRQNMRQSIAIDQRMNSTIGPFTDTSTRARSYLPSPDDFIQASPIPRDPSNPGAGVFWVYHRDADGKLAPDGKAQASYEAALAKFNNYKNSKGQTGAQARFADDAKEAWRAKNEYLHPKGPSKDFTQAGVDAYNKARLAIIVPANQAIRGTLQNLARPASSKSGNAPNQQPGLVRNIAGVNPRAFITPPPLIADPGCGNGQPCSPDQNITVRYMPNPVPNSVGIAPSASEDLQTEIDNIKIQ